MVAPLEDSGKVVPVGCNGQQRNQEMGFPHDEEDDHDHRVGHDKEGQGQSQQRHEGRFCRMVSAGKRGYDSDGG